MAKRTNTPLNELLENDTFPHIPPWAIVTHNMTQKFMQVGTFTFITWSPLLWLYQTQLRRPPLTFHWGSHLRNFYPKTLGISTGLGLAVGLYYVFSKLDEKAVTEEAQRLANNIPNNRVERRGLAAAAVGAVSYPFLFDKGVPVAKRMLRGGSFGYATGIVVALVLEGFFKRK